MIKQTCGLIYALVIASLMIPAVALALMAGRALAAEPQMPDFNLKPLFEFLDMLDRSWLGTLKNYDPNKPDRNRWNGVWPDTRVKDPSMVILFEPGGVIKEHIERWQELARSGADVRDSRSVLFGLHIDCGLRPKRTVVLWRFCYAAIPSRLESRNWKTVFRYQSVDAQAVPARNL